MKFNKIGLVVFAIGVVYMFLGALLPWYLLPLYLKYGPTEEFVAHVPIIVIDIWTFSVPIGAILTVIGGLIYGKK